MCIGKALSLPLFPSQSCGVAGPSLHPALHLGLPTVHSEEWGCSLSGAEGVWGLERQLQPRGDEYFEDS